MFAYASSFYLLLNVITSVAQHKAIVITRCIFNLDGNFFASGQSQARVSPYPCSFSRSDWWPAQQAAHLHRHVPALEDNGKLLYCYGSRSGCWAVVLIKIRWLLRAWIPHPSSSIPNLPSYLSFPSIPGFPPILKLPSIISLSPSSLDSYSTFSLWTSSTNR
jgi:hypothetical protein